ncbi:MULTISPECIES: hypothetical protein [Nitrosomonas]|uniref:Uncharacterized protein n=1 Tax=Nitrosomonas europaea (strain ATCC 19718 / CIP 103999 / KCTC 2705 / NBRC 14298) TaxID=228410 RepID=Q82SR6_NITEU|nr:MULTISPECIES: hypothetical protein [Nitrosomonas]CAD86153.1 hypothetical protein NE2241 [Nitrosomonas europaea ATCC 19718]SDW62059.1 hypothetical protein SAMN05216310_12534 [Nitrosomonas europaea]SET33142.1 hypothetical protein SAMN05216309_13615 [Nitrosomonas europaea]SJZ73375.1 hypothetical protein SAMN02745113_01744 [Nitrosomonas europaea]HBF25048.1 hypothetical protein [Nitrosomonas sp.]
MIKILLLLTSVLVAMPVAAVDVAPRISDREIIESLAELKAGQKALEEKMDLRFNAMQEQIDQRFTAIDQRFTAMQEQMDQRFTAVDQRFTAVDQHFTAMQKQIDQRFIAVDQRFEAIDRRLDFIQQLMLVTIAGIFGLIGFIIWDRYSTLRPMDMRLQRLEEDLERDLELQSPEGSKLTRLIHALRELAKEDKKVEAILRSFSLL